MRNLLMPEWGAKILKAAEHLRQKVGFAHIRVGYNPTDGQSERIHVESDRYSGTVELRSDGECLRAHGRLGSSTALPADLLDAHVALNEAREVVDLTAAAFSELREYKVWPREAPCDRCSTRGTTQGGKCKTCDGRGYRS